MLAATIQLVFGIQFGQAPERGLCFFVATDFKQGVAVEVEDVGIVGIQGSSLARQRERGR